MHSSPNSDGEKSWQEEVVSTVSDRAKERNKKIARRGFLALAVGGVSLVAAKKMDLLFEEGEAWDEQGVLHHKGSICNNQITFFSGMNRKNEELVNMVVLQIGGVKQEHEMHVGGDPIILSLDCGYVKLVLNDHNQLSYFISNKKSQD